MELVWRTNRDHNADRHDDHQGFTARTDQATYRVSATPARSTAWCLHIDRNGFVPNNRVTYRCDDVGDLYRCAQTTENELCSDAGTASINQ